MRKLLLIVAATATLAGTPALAARPGICIRHDDIRNWTALDDKRVVLENYHHQKALLTLIGTCSDLRFHEALEIRSPGAMGLSCIETGDTIVTRGFGTRGRCAITSVTPYAGPVTDKHHDADNHDGAHPADGH
ncbi:MAG: DUF6491 family protein [Rhizomicrobium sp.]